MGNKIALTVAPRETHGKKVAALRKQAIVPAVMYGAGMKPASVQVEYGAMEKVYRQAGKHTPIHLTIGSKKRIALIKSIEFDVLTHAIEHVSFHAVKANEPVVAEVPIRLVGMGESPAERAGLIVLQAIEQLQVKALPMDLPEALEVSVASLETADDKVTVADIAVPDGVEIVDNDDGREGTADDDQSVMDLAIASVYEPSALQAANDAAGGDAETADADAVEAENGDDAEKEEKAE